MINKWKAGLVLTALVLFPFACTFSRPMPVGAQAPDFALPTLEEPIKTVRLSEINADKPVLLVFWATWCPNCTEEIPRLNELHKNKPELPILAVNVDDTRKKIQEFMKKHPITYPVLLDEKGKATDVYNISGIPVVILLEKGGGVLYYGYGLPDSIDTLLKKETPSP